MEGAAAAPQSFPSLSVRVVHKVAVVTHSKFQFQPHSSLTLTCRVSITIANKMYVYNVCSPHQVFYPLFKAQGMKLTKFQEKLQEKHNRLSFSWLFKVSDYRIIARFGLEGTGGCHLVQPSGQSKANF